MTPYRHQVEIATQALAKLREYGLVYLAMEERTGKTLTAILTVENSLAKNCLVITKKRALDGWNDTLAKYKPTKKFDVINYHSLHKLQHGDYDIIILDESHAYLSKYPKPGTIWKNVALFTKKKPIIYLSATPSAQSYSLLYHQFKLSSWSPWAAYTTFYKWHKEYGIERTRFIGGRQFKEYNHTQEDRVWNECKHLFIKYTRKELGFEHEPTDELHFVKLTDYTRKLYRELEEKSIIKVGDVEIVADTPMSTLTKLHQIEGGTVKFEEEIYELENQEKIDYIKENWGDTEDLVIFYHYIGEKAKLEKHFKKAQILQATSYAEGVDLSMYEHLVVYSMNFSTAQYTQRRARQANMKRETPIKVHFILVENAISHQVYKTVAVNKKNFVDKYYTKGLV